MTNWPLPLRRRFLYYYSSRRHREAPRGWIKIHTIHNGEKNGKEKTECSVHETRDTQRRAGRGGRFQTASAHRSHQEVVGLHQEEQTARQEEQAHDPRRRSLAARVRRQERTGHRSEERRVGKECRSRWSPYH